MRDIIRWLCIITIVINFTFLFTFAAALGGISFKATGLFSLFALGLYCAYNLETVKELLRVKQVWFILILYSFWPLALTFISPVFPLSFIGYNILGLLLMVAAAILFRNEGVRRFGKIMLFAWFVSAVGIMTSLLAPNVFKQVASMQEDAKQTLNILQETRVATAEQSRAFGFYMQPNRAAYGTIIFAAILVVTYFQQRTVQRYLFLGATFFLILVTGSRGGLLQFMVLVALVIGNEFVSGLRVQGTRRSFFTVLPSLVLLAVVGLSGFFLVSYLTSDGVYRGGMLDRVFALFQGGGEGFMYDGSVQARLYAQEVYTSRILESPFIGHGMAANIFYQFTGGLPLSSHNAYFEYAFNYGVPATLLMWGGIFVISCGRRARGSARLLHYNFPFILAVVLIVSSLVLGGALYARFFSVALGVWLSVQFLHQKNEAPRRLPR